MDTADYSKDPAGITIHWNADGTLTVTDGYGGADTLDSIGGIMTSLGAWSRVQGRVSAGFCGF